jgi:hypothetical protein
MSTEHELDPELAKLIGQARNDTLEPDAIEKLASTFALAAPRPVLWKIFGAAGIGIGVIAALAFGLSPKKPVLLGRSGAVSPTLGPTTTVATPSVVIDLDDSPVQKKPAASVQSPEVQEFQLIRAARAALPTDPARALSLARTHEKKFPNGVLVQEREVIVISALKKLGQTGEADTRADEFKKAHPNSAHNPKFDPTKAP